MSDGALAQDSLREQVRSAVKASGLKQVWMAEKLGVSEKHLSNLLTGRAPLSLDWAEQIAGLCRMRVRIVVEPAKASRP